MPEQVVGAPTAIGFNSNILVSYKLCIARRFCLVFQIVCVSMLCWSTILVPFGKALSFVLGAWAVNET